MSDPYGINIEQVRAAYDAMGLDPEQWNNTRQVEFDPHEVRVTRYVRDEKGRILVADELGNPETCVTTMPIARVTP